jgi:hypothetical protein
MTQNTEFDLGKIGYAGAMAAAEGWEKLLNKGKQYPYEEVEAAFHDYAARANMNDWDHWCDIFTEECLYVDHHFGVFRTRAEIAKWMVPLMSRQSEMRFIPGWHVIKGNLVMNYNWNRWPNPDGSRVPYGEFRNPGPVDDYKYQFPCMTLNIYGGNGKFCYEEDLYSAPAYQETLKRWTEAMAKKK